MKTNYKVGRIIALLLVMSIVLSVGMTGFAATYSTTTTYNFGNDTVTVSSTVTGMGDEEVTYLATKSGGEILFVEQDVADADGTKTFEFTTTVSEMGTGKTKVLFGGASTNGVADMVNVEKGVDDTIALVTATIDAANASVTISDASSPVSGTAFKIGLGQEVSVSVEADDGYVISLITVEDDEDINVSPDVISANAFDVIGVAGLKITVEVDEDISEPSLEQVDISSQTTGDDELKGFAIFAAVNFATDAETAEYGIKVLKLNEGSSIPTKYEVFELGTPFVAYGVGTNKQFAVELIAGTAVDAKDAPIFADGNTYVAVVYLVDDEVTIICDVMTVTFGS